MTEPVQTSEWLTVPDLVEQLGLSVSRVRRLIEDRHLAAKRIDGVLKVPASFLRDGQPLGELRGTLIVLADDGFSDDEAVDWLLAQEESLGTSPIEALRAGRKAEVRRVAQALA
ncbi:Rv2175c family DNA-binding protein [Leifsonia virtsii]|uniref:Rv2175c family DNA-binding protein n=1 Tax=Leifsonia virtsii TaxID=3035915 RepID=A0ABT8ISQ7_9MICO|nr:Rv2175c family DNA-binding protein [Leifsonia virtsii]MDN4595824.1 Rv2175c family DNA-binding protein [Leifsonia virtsii]